MAPARSRRALPAAAHVTVRALTPDRVGTRTIRPVSTGDANRLVVPTSASAITSPVSSSRAYRRPSEASTDQTTPLPTTGEPAMFAGAFQSRRNVVDPTLVRSSPSLHGTKAAWAETSQAMPP